MKIVSIDKTHSTPHWTAFRTDARIAPEIQKLFLELYAARPEAGGIQVGFHGADIQLQGADFPAGFTEFVSQVLSQAESIVAHQKDVERQREQLADTQKTDALKRIAERQKLPIV
jgi:hypothetical protein